MIDHIYGMENNQFNVNLIDFGFAAKYLDKNGKHLEKML